MVNRTSLNLKRLWGIKKEMSLQSGVFHSSSEWVRSELWCVFQSISHHSPLFWYSPKLPPPIFAVHANHSSLSAISNKTSFCSTNIPAVMVAWAREDRKGKKQRNTSIASIMSKFITVQDLRRNFSMQLAGFKLPFHRLLYSILSAVSHRTKFSSLLSYKLPSLITLSHPRCKIHRLLRAGIILPRYIFLLLYSPQHHPCSSQRQSH